MKQTKIGQMKRYCIDTSALIDIKKWYPREIFPGIWEKLEQMVKRGELISHKTIIEEIKRVDDELCKWCNDEKLRAMFKETDDCQYEKFKEIKKKYDSKYWEIEISRTNNEWADPWLIALSICEEAIIVTSENKKNQNNIPAIAEKFKVHSLHLLEFFKEIGIKYEMIMQLAL